MRKLLSFLLLAVSTQAIAAGPKYGTAGGIGSSTSAYSGGEPAGGTYSINGATGVATLGGLSFGSVSAATGATNNLQILNPATGSVLRSVATKLRDWTDVADFGCDMTGATDATACLNNALASLPNGGRLHLRGRLLVAAGNLNIPAGTGIYGDCVAPGTILGNVGSNYATKTCGVILLGSAYTINTHGSSSIRSALIYRNGMTFPAVGGASSSFAGTAVTIGGDDVEIADTMIMGFAKAIYGTGVQRVRLTDLALDNTNGIEIANSPDTDYITRVHQWPFASITTGGTYTDQIRAGYAIYLHDVGDWAKITDCFSYGYARGVVLNNVNSVTLSGVGSDNAFGGSPLFANSIGLEITGTSNDIRVIGYQASAQATAGVRVNISAGNTVSFTNTAVWGGSTHGFLIDGGDVTINGGILGGLVGIANGVTVNNSSSRVSVSGVRFGTISGQAILATMPTGTVYIANNDISGTGAPMTGTNLGLPTVASAATITIPNTGDFFFVSGTTGISALNYGWAGRTVTLLFGSALTVTSGTAGVSGIHLNGGTNASMPASGTLTLKHTGIGWFEVSRTG